MLVFGVWGRVCALGCKAVVLFFVLFLVLVFGVCGRVCALGCKTVVVFLCFFCALVCAFFLCWFLEFVVGFVLWVAKQLWCSCAFFVL